LSLPPELCDVDIIYEIGSAVGEIISIDASFFNYNNFKILINLNIKHPLEFQKKIITRKASYVISFQAYKGKIIDILKSNIIHNNRPKVLPLTSEFRNKFPGLSSKLVRKDKNPGEQIHHPEIQIGQDSPIGQRASLKSIISDKIEGLLLTSKMDLTEVTKVKKTCVSPKNDKELKGT